MTDAPEKVWVFPCAGCTMLAAETEQTNPDAITYIREDVALAMVAAHGERCRNAAITSQSLWAAPSARIDIANAIDRLTPADAKAALDRLIAEAATDAAKEAESYAGELEDVFESVKAKLATCEKYRDAYAECDRIGTQSVRELEAKLAKIISLADAMAEAIEDQIDTCDASMDEQIAVKNYRTTIKKLTGGKDD